MLAGECQGKGGTEKKIYHNFKLHPGKQNSKTSLKCLCWMYQNITQLYQNNFASYLLRRIESTQDGCNIDQTQVQEMWWRKLLSHSALSRRHLKLEGISIMAFHGLKAPNACTPTVLSYTGLISVAQRSRCRCTAAGHCSLHTFLTSNCRCNAAEWLKLS